VTEDFHEEAAPASRLALELLEVFASAGLKAAVGGSLALSLWGVARGTKDADLNVFVGEEQYRTVLALCKSAGYWPDPERGEWTDADDERFLQRAREGEAAVVYKQSMRVDLFVPSIDFYGDAERTLRSVTLRSGRTILALSAEALCVFKLLFFREKDLLDLKRLVSRQGAALDHRWVRDHLSAMFPAGDERIDVWDAIVRDHGPGAVP
jgi:hypothetical protein